jgi:hypothetical protein
MLLSSHPGAVVQVHSVAASSGEEISVLWVRVGALKTRLYAVRPSLFVGRGQTFRQWVSQDTCQDDESRRCT